MILNTELGRIEMKTVPLPDGLGDISGTYTPSGRVLVSYRTPEDWKTGRDYYHAFTVKDDGTDIRPVFGGMIPRQKGANGVRWLCFSDNRRILMGDYIIETEPDLDHADITKTKLIDIEYPDAVMKAPRVYVRWSEVIPAPDGKHIAWTTLTFSGSANFLGRLVRKEDRYVVEGAKCISTRDAFVRDEEHEGYVIPRKMRGGELKQFICGGTAVTQVGNSDTLCDSVIEHLDTGAIEQYSHTAGYEETAIFSPDMQLALCMSPRFSPATDCSVFGTVPLPHSMPVRSNIIAVTYSYAISSVRLYRRGNIGPVLTEVKRAMQEGRACRGVDLHDPEEKFVYTTPMSFAPDSCRCMWNERTRGPETQKQCRIRTARLLDRKGGAAVPAVPTPEPETVAYATPAEEALLPGETFAFPFRIRGKADGEIICEKNSEGWTVETYDNFSDDGRTFYNGTIRSKAPRNTLSGSGKVSFAGDLTVTGAHTGRISCLVSFAQNGLNPAELEDDSFGYSEYDGVRADVNTMRQK